MEKTLCSGHITQSISRPDCFEGNLHIFPQFCWDKLQRKATVLHGLMECQNQKNEKPKQKKRKKKKEDL